jgi:phage major head subunit gpT-like protein
MWTNSQNYAIAQIELNRVFFQKFNEVNGFPGNATASNPDVFKQETTTNAAFIQEVYSGVGMFDALGETTVVPESTPKVANKLTTYVIDYAKGVPLSKDLFDDNLHNVYDATVTDMALKARRTQDYTAMGVYRGAFVTTTIHDGTYLIAASHTLIGGGTQSNLITGALSTTTLNNAIVALAEMKSQDGVIMGSVPSALLVPPALWKHALEITESALIADSANNNLNVYRSAMGLKVYTSPYLGAAAGGSDTAWFLLAPEHSVTRLVRQGVQTALTDWTYSKNRSYYFQANYREVTYAVDYIGIVGSTGV